MSLPWLDELRARRASITPRPWHSQGWDFEEEYVPVLGGGVPGSSHECQVAACAPMGRRPEACLADADFIANAPADADRLIALAEAGWQLEASFRGLSMLSFEQAWAQFRTVLHGEQDGAA